MQWESLFPHQPRSLAISIMSWQQIICNRFWSGATKDTDTMYGVKPYLSPNTAISRIGELILLVYFHFSYKKQKTFCGEKKKIPIWAVRALENKASSPTAWRGSHTGEDGWLALMQSSFAHITKKSAEALKWYSTRLSYAESPRKSNRLVSVQ